MHSMDNYYAGKLIDLMAEADLHVVANPTANMLLMGRRDTYPKRRGMTRVPELMAAGIDVSLGQDSVMDPWGPLNAADMLDVAHMAVHAGHLSGREQILACFKSVTEYPGPPVGSGGIRAGNPAATEMRSYCRRRIPWRQSASGRRAST